MQALISFFIFVFVLFVYIHVTSVWKKSEDLEVYEVDYTTHRALQDVVSIKQPVLFQLEIHHPNFFNKMSLSKMEKYDNYDVNIKDLADYKKEDSVYSLALPMRSATKLMATDTHARYVCEDNARFLEESGFDAVAHSLDTFLKPTFTVSRIYDFMYGSKHACTPLKYHIDYQYYIVVNEGKIRMKMTPWKSTRNLDPISDYENYEFRSLLNPWKPEERKREYEKIRFLDFEVYAGSVLFIPAYWWYSICFSGEMLNSLTVVRYNTGASVLANLNHLGKYVLQQNNTKTKVVKTLPVSLDGGGEAAHEKEIEKTEEESSPLFEGRKSTNTEIVTNTGVYKTTGELGDSTYVDSTMSKKSIAESK